MAALFPFGTQFFDNSGDPLNGGKLYFYSAGTSTPKNTFTTQAGTTPNANPVVLDSAGRANIWGSGSYKVVIKTSADVTLVTLDNVNVDAAIIGGTLNSISTNDGTNAIVGGDSLTMTGTPAFCAMVGGDVNTIASGSLDVIIGGGSNVITSSGGSNVIAGGTACTIEGGGGGAVIGGNNSKVTGVAAATFGDGAYASKRYQIAHGNGDWSLGESQASQHILSRTTTDATPSELFLNGASGRLTIPTDTTWGFDILVVARRTDADNESAFYRFEGCIDNNAGTTALVGSVVAATPIEDTAGWACAVTADNTNDALIITATGAASSTVRWVAFVRTVEVTG